MSIPFILRNNTDILDVLMVNQKAVEKTIEAKQLWILHPMTHKVVLHVPEIEIDTVIKKSNSSYPWVEAYTSFSLVMYFDVQNQKIVCNDFAKNSKSLSKDEEKMQAQPIVEISDSVVSSIQSYSFLETLHAILLQRKATMPEGSYSSYLFSKGEEKIKKKLGEEVVELILAKNEHELCNEAADVLYHLWVYFVEKGILPLSIIEVLHNRLDTK